VAVVGAAAVVVDGVFPLADPLADDALLLLLLLLSALAFVVAVAEAVAPLLIFFF
jgi:hypothetical protein